VLCATTKFAVIGDFGSAGQAELDVANRVKSWSPDYVVTVGDNNYDTGSAATIDANIGQYYQQFIGNYVGTYGAGSPTNRFWPVLGNHDWGNASNNPTGWFPYRDYFTLPNNERYYEFAAGPVRFFMLDSDANEPDGITRASVQAAWLKSRLAAAAEPHKVVMLHHAPYSSSTGHGSTAASQWPFSQWGATLVLAGHDHTYERLFNEGIPYVVNGLGGRSLYTFGTPVAGSQFRYAADYGAQLVTADDTSMTMQFYTRGGTLIDSYTINLPATKNVVSVEATGAAATEAGGGGAFTVSRAGYDLSQPLVVPLTFGGTAKAGSDYAALPASVTIPAGQQSALVPVSVINDTAGEAAETITLTLPASASYNLGQDTAATVTIADDDTSSALLFAGGSTWRYKDDGTDQGTAWRAPAYNDSAWSSGNARFGYGDPGIVTTINSGPSGARTTTHYFRTTFNVASPATISAATLNVLRDDGAVIYLNGAEVWRTNMPTGAVTAGTFASTAVGGTDETTFFNTALSPASLVAGTNTWAVELHQSNLTTSDAAFDLYLTGVTDTSAPVNTSRQFDPGTGPRLRFGFSEDVAASLAGGGALTVVNRDTNVALPASAFALGASGDLTLATWTATAGLPDGRYRASLSSGVIKDASGNALTAAAPFDFTFFRGDMNGDGAVNNLDIAPFVQGLTNASGFAASFGYAPDLLGDVNRDGSFNNLDISAFVAVLTGGTPTQPVAPAPATRQPRAAVAADVLGRPEGDRAAAAGLD
jgi:hypothetical protein